MTIPADLDPHVEVGNSIATPKMRSPVQLRGDQVMEGELSGLATASAILLGVLWSNTVYSKVSIATFFSHVLAC